MMMEVIEHLRTVSVADCLAVAANHRGLTPDRLLALDRTKPVAFARHIAMWLATAATGKSTVAIGRMIGNRDHSTVCHGRDRIIKMRGIDLHFCGETDRLLRDLLHRGS